MTWYRQPRDNKTGKWYSDNPRWWVMCLRLNTDEREELEMLAQELGICMTDCVVHGLKLLRQALETEGEAVKDAAAAAPAEAGHAP